MFLYSPPSIQGNVHPVTGYVSPLMGSPNVTFIGAPSPLLSAQSTIVTYHPPSPSINTTGITIASTAKRFFRG